VNAKLWIMKAEGEEQMHDEDYGGGSSKEPGAAIRRD
jgi:hypothetical protein